MPEVFSNESLLPVYCNLENKYDEEKNKNISD